VLRAGTGEVGQQLMGRRHSLTVDLTSLNGTAMIERRAVIVENTETSLTHRPNPLLPDTRSEMVVPLLVGERVVGTLDMQSVQAGALNKGNLDAFEALAGQLAIAIENASLIAETEAARAAVEAQSRRLIHEGWREFLNAIQHGERIGYTYDLEKVAPFDEPLLAEPDSRTLITAIPVSNEPVGVFKFVAEQTWSEDAAALVSSVAQQLGQQIENLRLLAQADQYRAETEKALRLMTHEGWESQLADHPDARTGYLYNHNQVLSLSSADGNDSQPVATHVLAIAGERIGEISVGGTSATHEEIDEILTTVGEQLSARVENLRLLDQSQSALAQSEKLFDASRSLTQATDLQKLVDAAVSTLNIPQINRAVLTTFNYDSNGSIESLDIIANWWNGSGHEVTPVGTHYPLEVIRVMPMFVSPTPVFFNDSLNDERVDAVTLDLVKRQNLRAVAVLPLILGSRQIGALILEAEDPHNFTQNEIRLFSSLAPQIATILENRRQYERAQRQAERETMLNAINQKIQSATSVEAVLQIAARELGRALGAPLTIAQLGMNGKK
jgi:GAF domain-containing protein